VQVLRSDEGRELRDRHQENVRYVRGKLLEAGLPVVHTPSHIIPVHVASRRDCSLCMSSFLSVTNVKETGFVYYYTVSQKCSQL